jgi:transcriptional regulator with XRE-family HTH domain
MQVGSVIRTLRSAAGLSQQAFARQLEITASYLSLIEHSRREPTVRLLRRMAAVLGAPAAVLFAAALVTEGSGHVGQAERKIVEHLVESVRMTMLLDRAIPNRTDVHNG